MFQQVEQERLQSELARERNQDLLTSFASDYAVHFLILQKGAGEEVRLEVERGPRVQEQDRSPAEEAQHWDHHEGVGQGDQCDPEE